ncbi:hypothetical protein KOR34_48350 [Posidoniimonas corsicana]|uniref:Uncharacterized protein n=1 Tax=Posidoniimonas corsicana TaxID=1938618 RepID=A0A5C5UXM6_9BACT|nr:hypothetical protein [Posidoniimonas corsicana]TWT30277.1 hypothetical protein KOR34_48350 [Posidoniimonas corsicana]
MVEGWRCGAVLLLLAAGAAVGCGRPTAAPTINSLRQAYVRSEGHGSRGARFCQLVLAMDDESIAGTVPGTRAGLLNVLGPPDLTRRSALGSQDVYFYDRFAKRDWVVQVEYDPAGAVMGFGYNAASALDLSEWQSAEAGTP